MSADDGRGLDAEPLFKRGAVYASEIDVVGHILAVESFGSLDRRGLGVQSAGYLVADEECPSA